MDILIKITNLIIDKEHEGRTVLQLLRSMNSCKDSRLYKACRSGEVRVNKGRVKFSYRLQIGDQVRLPVFNKPVVNHKTIPDWLKQSIIYEDDSIVALNKPAGISVHAGSCSDIGIIELMRADPAWLDNKLDLVHRLDKLTSGVLLIAKNCLVKRDLAEQFRARTIEKQYLALLEGHLPSTTKVLIDNLLNVEFKVICDVSGKSAITEILTVEHLHTEANEPITKVILKPKTGRKHQLRVQCQNAGHPIVGDQQYGSTFAGKLFLHALEISFLVDGQLLKITADLPEEKLNCLKYLKNIN